MVAYARAKLADPTEVGTYHVWNRVVRRAFLCGWDPVSQTNYDYRRDWITDREQLLAQLFAIDIGFHAEMSNHIHLVLRTRPDIVATWSDQEVIRRWLTITKLTRSFGNERIAPDEHRVEMLASDAKYVARVRVNLSNISCFMGALQEYVARRANAEDGKRGRFWETRFQCRKCADEAAVIICGIYVDLNQIRAKEATTPEESIHTSASDRIRAWQQAAGVSERTAGGTASSPTAPADAWLSPLTIDQGPQADVRPGIGSSTPWRASDKGMIPLTREAYFSLLDWTGRQLRADKPGVIPSHLQPILERLRIRPQRWLDIIQSLDHSFRRVLGRVESLMAAALAAGQHWLHGVRQAAELFA